jgi:Zn-finger nucleic acid-binding protein
MAAFRLMPISSCLMTDSHNNDNDTNPASLVDQANKRSKLLRTQQSVLTAKYNRHKESNDRNNIDDQQSRAEEYEYKKTQRAITAELKTVDRFVVGIMAETTE